MDLMVFLDNNRDLMRELYSIVSIDLLVSESSKRVFAGVAKSSSGGLVCLVVSSPVILVASSFFDCDGFDGSAMVAEGLKGSVLVVDGVSSCFWDCKLCSLGDVSVGELVGGEVNCDGLDGLE